MAWRWSRGRPGLLLGLEPDPNLVDHTLELQPGDALMLYTDGLTDAYAPDRALAPDDLAGLLAACAGRSASEIVDRMLQAALDDDSRQPRDDIALVVLRLTPQVVARRVAQRSATATYA